MESDFEVKQKLKRAQKAVAAVQGVYVHAMCYVGVNLATLTYWYFDDFIAPVFWPRCFTILTGACGIVLLSHAAVVFGSQWLTKRNWEEEKIKQLIAKDKPTKTK